MPQPTLVVLAAGMSSRYGRLKQLEPVGPGGATLMEYAVYDAVRAGIARALFVIRPELEDTFRGFARGRFGSLEVVTAHQAIPPGRAKPWGTAEAVLVAQARVDGPFCVINADDIYGRSALAAAARFLDGGRPREWAVVGYRLADTLSPSGGVNRAVCRTDAEGWLTGIEERLDIVRAEGDELVSMNLWAFSADAFAALRDAFERFRAGPGAADAEFPLPTAVDETVRRGAARVRVLRADARWVGMTHHGDRAVVAAELRALVEAGSYPERLWAADPA